MYHSVQERERAKNEFKKLIRDKRPTVQLLYDQLADFMYTVVQDDICIHNQSHEHRLHDLLCQFSFVYVPVPLASDLVHHGNLVNQQPVLAKGSNGRIFNSGVFEGNPIVTKTKKKWSENTIFEVYLNMVVINSFLLKGQYVNQLLPSYGIFLCGSNQDGTQICHGDVTGNHLFLVQKKIEGLTLKKRLESDYSLASYQRILKQVLDIMVFFESSPYRMYHMDMHDSNIIVSSENGEEYPVIIDFELASWTVHERNGTPHRYRLNSVENKYCGKEIVYTGAYDVVLFLSSTAHSSSNPEIKAYALDKLTSIFHGTFWKDEGVEFTVSLSLFTKHSDRWLYHLLAQAEKDIYSKQNVHRHNVAELEKMKCSFLRNTFFSDIM
jgi:hypothetical protein